MENKTYEYIVIGAGYGGVTAASLLAANGVDVLLLESHTVIGGCASFYKRKNFTFDVGATTFSGVLPHQPLGKLFDELGIKPNLKKLDPGMVIMMGTQKIIRHAEKEKWIEEAIRVFGEKGQKLFWNELYALSEKAWAIVGANYKIPPVDITDFVSLFKIKNIKALPLLKALFTPVSSLLKKCGLHEHPMFYRFIKEQLLITSQNTPEDTPLLTAAMGLTYPSETYYPYGGMYKPGQLLLDKFKDNGGIVKFKSKVSEILSIPGGYELKTMKGESYFTRGLISNIPVWNLAKITEGKAKKYFENFTRKFPKAWGAFTLYFAIESRVELETLYYQIHTKREIPFIESNAFFVSFSAQDDVEKAPEGWRTITISAHVDVQKWNLDDIDEYERRKVMVTERFIEEFDLAFECFSGLEKLHLLSGTPGTFEFFTGRFKGYVGGIPHSVKNNLLRLPPGKTPFSNFYITGDTVFPGQGTPAVVLGALNVVKRILI